MRSETRTQREISAEILVALKTCGSFITADHYHPGRNQRNAGPRSVNFHIYSCVANLIKCSVDQKEELQ